MTNQARIYNGDRTVSSTNAAGKTGQLHVRVKLEHYLRTCTKNKNKKTKWFKGLSVR